MFCFFSWQLQASWRSIFACFLCWFDSCVKTIPRCSCANWGAGNLFL